MHPLSRCLNPRSIAVVGGKEAERVLEQCQKLGFTGDLWPINPKRETLAGIPCFSSIDELPSAPDVAFVAIPAEPSIPVISALANMDAGGAICYASGFGEVGAHERHQQLIDASGDMPVIGPNCYGYINAISSAALWPDQHGLTPVGSGVAIFSSSGNVSINMTMQQRSLPIAMIVTIGNQAMVGIEHCIEAVLDDDRITAIGIHIEGLKNLTLFTKLAKKAATKRKPIVALKTGRSEVGASITMSHTATLAGEAGLYDSLFQRLGVAQANNLDDFLEALKLLSATGPLNGSRIASMSCSGGEASLIADLTMNSIIQFPALTEEHTEQVQVTLNEYVNVINPLDYHTFIWGDKERLQATFSAMLQGNFDLTLLLLDYPNTNNCDMQEWIDAGDAFVDACKATNKKGVIVCALAENIPANVRNHLMQRGVPPLLGMTQALAAIEAAATACKIVDIPPKFTNNPQLTSIEKQSSSEFAAKQQLAAAGLTIAPSEIATTLESAVQAASNIGYPVVIKACGEALIHKTELDAVQLNIQNPEEVKPYVERLLTLSGEVMVEKMITDGIAELLLGVNHDSQFGHYIVIGFGGTLVELIADRQILLLPASNEQIKQTIFNLKTAKLLQGYRGKPEADIDAVVQTVQHLIKFIEVHKDTLQEIDINPLIIHPKGQGVTVADALIVHSK